MTTPSIQRQRDNLNIGLFLAAHPYGKELDEVLEGALGYIPGVANNRSIYSRRLRSAEDAGRNAFRARSPGYFTFNAQPFGRTWLYKVIWYVWVNPQSAHAQAIPIENSDLRSMRGRRDKELETRTSTTRSIRAADDIQEEKEAIASGDAQTLSFIQQRMVDDGSFGEIFPACTVFHSQTSRQSYLS